MRDDILSVSVGADAIATIKAEAFERGMPVSALVRSWISTLADGKADDD